MKFLITIILLALLTSCSNQKNDIISDIISAHDARIELFLRNEYELETRIFELEMEMQESNSHVLETEERNYRLESEIQKLNNRISGMQSQICTPINQQHQIFYGEWRATDRIFMSPMPVRGLLLPVEEMKEDIANFAEQIRGETIQFSRDFVIINGDEKIDGIHYSIILYPSNNYFNVDMMLTFADIGLSGSEGNYFAFVSVLSRNQARIVPRKEFFVKDINTLIVLRNGGIGGFFVEYERVAFDENHRIPFNWLPPVNRVRDFVFPWEMDN